MSSSGLLSFWLWAGTLALHEVAICNVLVDEKCGDSPYGDRRRLCHGWPGCMFAVAAAGASARSTCLTAPSGETDWMLRMRGKVKVSIKECAEFFRRPCLRHSSIPAVLFLFTESEQWVLRAPQKIMLTKRLVTIGGHFVILAILSLLNRPTKWSYKTTFNRVFQSVQHLLKVHVSGICLFWWCYFFLLSPNSGS